MNVVYDTFILYTQSGQTGVTPRLQISAQA